MKILRLFQYAYIAFAAIFLFDAITNWNTDRSRSYMSLFFVALAVFMFFFRKRFSKRLQDRNNSK